MNRISFFIENYRFTILAFLILTILGFYSYILMPRGENPNITIPGTTITALYPGANPTDLEQLVAKPIEDEINELEDIKSIKTYLSEGVSITNIEFIYGVDPDEKYDEVLQKVNKVKTSLPDDIYDLKTNQWKSSDVAMYHLALINDSLPYAELQNRAEELDERLSRNPNVRKVEILACPEQEVRISLDMLKMAQMNISVSQISKAVLLTNKNIPAGVLDLSNKSFGVKTSGHYNSIEQIKNTIITTNNGHIEYLKNIADIHFDYEDVKYYAQYDGERAIFMTVLQKEGTNIFRIKDELNQTIKDFKNKYRSDMELKYVFDQSNEIASKVKTFQVNLVQGILIVGLIIFIMLGGKPSLLVILAIPLSIILAFFPIYQLGFGIQQMTIAGLVISLGLLVDNSIVTVENIQRFKYMGYSSKQAALKGTSELASPIISATITTIIAFIPIIMIPDKAGDFMKSMPLTVIFVLIASLFIALALTPLIATYVFKHSGKQNSNQNKSHKSPLAEKIIKRFINGWYTQLLRWVLKNKILVLILAIAILAVSMRVFKDIEKSFFPKAEKPQFLIRIEMPGGSNIEYTKRVTQKIGSVIDSLEGVKFYASNIGHGNPRIYYNVPVKSYSKEYAEIFVQLKDYNPQEFKQLIASLRDRFNRYNIAQIHVKEFEQGPHTEAPIMIYLTGPKIDTLRKISSDVEAILSNQKGVINIKNPIQDNITDLHFNINREKAARLGISLAQIDQTVRTAIAGQKASVYQDNDGEDYDIVIRLPQKDKITRNDLDKIYVYSVFGKSVPLKQLSQLQFKKAPGIITRYNLNRSAPVSGNLTDDASLDKIMSRVVAKLDKYSFPPDYGYTISGELEQRNKSFGGMRIALIIALTAIFMVLVLQFKSYIQPLIIYSVLPFAVIGMVWGLFLSHNPFSLTAFIGFISLTGIVINDTIILVSFANDQKSQGQSTSDALEIACKKRFIPIVLTSITTIGGLLPLTLSGGSMWAPMGWTIMGGLTISTMLTLLIVPVLYKLFTKK